MRCDDIDAHLADLLGGELRGPAFEALRRHLSGCPSCRRQAEGTLETWQLLGEIPGQPVHTAALRARFERALDEGTIASGSPAATSLDGGRPRLEHLDQERVAAARPKASHEPPAGRWTARWQVPAFQAVAAGLLLLVGVVIGRQSAAQPTEIGAMREELRDLRQTVTLSLMQQQSASERLRGVSWSNQVESPDEAVVAALLEMMMHDPNVNVRLSSIDALKRFADQRQVRGAAVEALTDAPSPLVQVALIDFVVELNVRDAVATLQRLSNDAGVNEAVRTRAARGVRQLGATS